MAENFDSLTYLLQFLEPDRSANKRYALVAQVNPEQWDALINEADRQEVAPYLYSLLVDLEITHHLEIPHKEKLRQSCLSTAAQNLRALHDAEIVFSALRVGGLPAAGLKGVYLLEHAYPDIGARSMSDIDILIHKKDLAECIQILEGLGYCSTSYFSLDDENTDTKHLPPMDRGGGPLVELHWTLLEEDEPFTIDAERLWERMMPVRIANVDVLALGLEDLILHLCLHLTYQHYLNLGLHGLMDIALVIHKFRSEIDWQKLVRIAQSWGAERVIALTLKLVETQLNIPIPAEVFSGLMPGGIETQLLDQARSQLLNRVRFIDPFTPDLVEMSAKNNLIAKIKIGLQRVFIPRLALARTYNIPPNSPRILGLYWTRLKYLIRKYGKTVLKLEREEAGIEPARKKAEISKSLHEWMTQRGK